MFIGNFKDGMTLAIKHASGLVSSSQGLVEFPNEVDWLNLPNATHLISKRYLYLNKFELYFFSFFCCMYYGVRLNLL